MPTLQWLQHPATVFLLPLITLLCAPNIYKFLPAGTDPSYDDAKLQRIANLIDDIYSTLANLTFIPYNAVQRGPHQINTTALPCKPSASVLRLVETLPYIDFSLVHEPDWIYGGHFMDYRNPEHLAELCDPLRGQGIGWNDYISPSDIALTNWGTGGWNNDRTWVMIYNTERDAIRIFDAEMWLERIQAQHEFGEEMNDWWFEDDGKWIWDRVDGAPHILRAIANNYRTMKWTPWETSNHEPSFGLVDRLEANKVDAFSLDDDYLKDAMKRSGWPHAFDHVKFNADVIRAQHAPRSQTMTEAVQAQIDSIISAKARVKERLAHHRARFAKATTEDGRWVQRWRIQQCEWDLESISADLSLVEQEKAEMCPNNVCDPDPTPILWQQWALSRKLEAAEDTNHTETCDQRFQYLKSLDANLGRVPNYHTISRLEACLANEEIKLSYIRRAYLDSKADALRHCEKIGCKLLRADDIRARARLISTMYEREIATNKARIAKSLTFASHLPTDAKAALSETHKSVAQLEHDIQRSKASVEHIETLINKAIEGENELCFALVAMYEIRAPVEDEDSELNEETHREYLRWMWLKKVQKQAESKGGLGDTEKEAEL